MRVSPPLAITGIIAASFAWMAWEYRSHSGTWRIGPATVNNVYWQCEDGSREPVIWDQPAKCPQWDGLDYGVHNGIPHEHKTRTIYYYGEPMDDAR